MISYILLLHYKKTLKNYYITFKNTKCWHYNIIYIYFFPLFSASAAGKSLAVSEETERSMRVSWTPAPGKVAHYRLKYSPIGGGKEMFLKVPGTSSSTVMKRLQPTTTYTITVNPIYKRGEGKARQGVGTTRTFWSIIQPSDRTAHRRNTKHPKQDV